MNFTSKYITNLNKLIIFTFLTIIIGFGCTTKSNNTEQIDPNDKNPYKNWDSQQLSEFYFTDSLKKARFDNGIYKATFYSSNGKYYLDFAIEIQCDFGNFDVKYASPENIKLSHNFTKLTNYNTNEIEFDSFEDMIFSFDRDRDDQVAILKKTIEIDKEFGLYSFFRGLKIDDLNNFPLILDYSEINIEYEIGDDKFYKKVVPKYKVNTKQEIVNNYLLTPYFQIDNLGQVIFDVEITKKSDIFDVYFASSEKVFLNIYSWNENRNNNKSIKIFDSSHKMNYMTAVDDNVPIGKGESKFYSYVWNSKFNLDNESNNSNEFFDFELGIRMSPKQDLVKTQLFVIYK
ncbi:MAG: hypothetical protein ACOVNU_07405 [Candidatus Kapaibacteriota bacterium]|jgi:hypothetical protein